MQNTEHTIFKAKEIWGAPTSRRESGRHKALGKASTFSRWSSVQYSHVLGPEISAPTSLRWLVVAVFYKPRLMVGEAVWGLGFLRATSMRVPGAIKYLKPDGHKYHYKDKGRNTSQYNLTHGEFRALWREVIRYWLLSLQDASSSVSLKKGWGSLQS